MKLTGHVVLKYNTFHLFHLLLKNLMKLYRFSLKVPKVATRSLTGQFSSNARSSLRVPSVQEDTLSSRWSQLFPFVSNKPGNPV